MVEAQLNKIAFSKRNARRLFFAKISFLIYGSLAWSVGFGTLKTDLAFLWYLDFIWGWDLGVVLMCPLY